MEFHLENYITNNIKISLPQVEAGNGCAQRVLIHENPIGLEKVNVAPPPIGLSAHIVPSWAIIAL